MKELDFKRISCRNIFPVPVFFRNLLLFIFLFTDTYHIRSEHSVTFKDGLSVLTKDILYNDEFFTINSEKVSRNEISHITMSSISSSDLKSLSLEKTDHNELLKRASYMEEKYPDQPKLILLDEGFEKLYADGRSVIRSRYAVKIMNESQLDYANISLYNSSGKVESKLIYARSISPDGIIEYLDMNTITTTSPSRGTQFYGNDREVTISKAVIPGVRPGSIIDYEYERTVISREDPKQFFTQWYFNGTSPVYSSEFTVMIAEGREFYIHKNAINPDLFTETIRKAEGFTVYTYSYKESPPVVIEKQGPKLAEILSYIYGSSFKDQSYLSKWLSAFFVERMEVNSEITKAVSEVIKDLKTEEEKIEALYYYMQRNIRYLSIKTSLSSGLAGHRASETFSNKYGDCIDKSILFAAVLKSVGIEAYPVIVMTNDNPQPLYGKIGTLDGNHAINEIHLKSGKVIYLDTTGNSYRYPFFRSDNHGITAWNPIKNTFRNTGFPSVNDNSIITNSEIHLKTNLTADIKEVTTTRGTEEVRFREYFRQAQKEQIKSVMEFFANRSFTGSTLSDYYFDQPADMTNDYSYTIHYSVPSILDKAGNIYLLRIRQDFGFDFVSPVERKTPVIFQTVLNRIYKGSIEIPENFEVTALPPDLEIETEYLKYSGKYRTDGNKIYYENIYSRNKTYVPVSDYTELRNSLIKINDYIRSPILLKNKK